MSKPNGPVLIELDDDTVPGPDQAPPVPESADLPEGRAMQGVVRLASRQPSALARWFWRLAGSLATFGLSLWAWDTLNALIARNPVLGYTAAALTGAFLLVCLGIVLREWAAFARLRRIDGIKTAASAALAAVLIPSIRRSRAKAAHSRSTIPRQTSRNAPVSAAAV